VPLLIGTMVILVLLGKRCFRTRRVDAETCPSTRTLVEQYRLDSGVFQLACARVLRLWERRSQKSTSMRIRD
jgi:hypothetical protein